MNKKRGIKGEKGMMKKERKNGIKGKTGKNGKERNEEKIEE